MDILINNEKTNYSFDENIKIGKAINIISSNLKNENKVICQLMIDDVIIPEEEEKQFFEYEIASAKSIKLLVDSVDNLIMNGLKSLKDLIPELVEIINKTAYFHRTGEETKAKNMFSASLQAMEIVPTILNNIRATLNLDFGKIKSGDMTLQALEEGMLKAISSIFEAQKKEDYVTLADILEYELVPNFLMWNNSIPVIEDVCRERINKR